MRTICKIKVLFRRVISVMDVAKAIRLCVDSGKVKMGAKTALKATLLGEPKLLVIAANAPADEAGDLKSAARHSKVPVMNYSGSSIELGVACGKPFPVSALAVISEGDSSLLESVKK